MTESTIRYWQSLSSAEIADVVARDPVVILPLAAIEQHGPHLPLSTDLEIGMGVLAEAFRNLPDDFPAWVLPPQAVGASLEHAHIAGTLSLDADLLGALIRAHGEALARCGVQRLVLANSHGGNGHVIDAAGLSLREACGLLVVRTTYAKFTPPADVDIPAAEWRHGLHGGAVETAMMLHLRPDLVRGAAVARAESLGATLEASARRLGTQGAAAFSWLADDLHPSGVTGDATLATADMGRRLVAYYGAALADVIRDAREFPVDRLAGR